MELIAFYILAAIVTVSAVAVIAAKNPVHSVLWLITAFFTSAGLLVLIGAEFLAMLLVVVYVGAVAVLFLFVVMMLDVDFAELRQGFVQYLPFGGVIALVIATEMVMVVAAVATNGAAAKNALPNASPGGVPNTEAIGRVLYTDYVFFFQLAGLVLLVAMIGAIVLTLRHKPGVKRQDIGKQVARTPKTGMELVQIKPGEGISE